MANVFQSSSGKVLQSSSGKVVEGTDHCCCAATCFTCGATTPRLITVALSGMTACATCVKLDGSTYYDYTGILSLPTGAQMTQRSIDPCEWRHWTEDFQTVNRYTDATCTTPDTPSTELMHLVHNLRISIGPTWTLTVYLTNSTFETTNPLARLWYFKKLSGTFTDCTAVPSGSSDHVLGDCGVTDRIIAYGGSATFSIP